MNCGCEIIKNILETQDLQLMQTRNKKEYRHKGYKTNTIKTVMGEIAYKRAIYKKGNKYIFLLDSQFDINTVGKISSNLAEIMLKTVVNTTSYRKASNEIINTTNETISHQALNALVWKVGKIIEDKENEEIKLMKQDKLIKGKKETLALFEEADGIWFNLQGKDRKEAQERYKKECEKKNNKYDENRKMKKELKLHITYEGWKKDSKRHELINKKYLAGIMSVQKLKKLRNARIYQEYNEKSIQLRVINGDGASWINSIATKDTIRQKDLFHIQQEIIRDISEKQYQEELASIINNKEYDKVHDYIEHLKYELGGEEKTVKKLEKLQKYLKEGLPRYKDILQKENKQIPNAPQRY